MVLQKRVASRASKLHAQPVFLFSEPRAFCKETELQGAREEEEENNIQFELLVSRCSTAIICRPVKEDEEAQVGSGIAALVFVPNELFTME